MWSLVFLSVTDLELLAGQVAKSLLVLLFVFSALFNVRRFFRPQGAGRRALRILMAVLFVLPVLFLVHWIRIEDQLLRKAVYTVGTTIGPCTVFARGKGIEFEYEAKGRKFRACNTYHPIPLDSIKVPGGKYRVRYSERFPEEGRINFMEKVE